MRISDWSSDVCSSDLLRDDAVDAEYVRAVAEFGIDDGAAADEGAGSAGHVHGWSLQAEIGRASCRERVCVRVDLGGRRIIKKKNQIKYIEQHTAQYQSNHQASGRKDKRISYIT